MQLTPESHNRINIYYASFTKVLSELVRFSGNNQETLCALGEICHRETPDKESFSCIGKILQNFQQDSGSQAENVRKLSFCCECGFHYMAVQNHFRTTEDNTWELFKWYVSRAFTGNFPMWCISLQWYLLQHVQQHNYSVFSIFSQNHECSSV